MVVTEGEFVNVAAKVILAYVLVDAAKSALEDAEKVFHGVSGHVAAHILAGRVIWS